MTSSTGQSNTNQSKTNQSSTAKQATQRSKKTTAKTYNERLKEVMDRIRLTEEGKILIDGRNYTTVAKRNELFRQEFGFDVKIPTEILHMQDNLVVVKAAICIKDDGEWHEVATGHAEENRGQSQMNQVSALENAETSAIGRALANIGLSGGEFASANEVPNKQQKPQQSKKMINKHQKQKLDQEMASNEDLEEALLNEYNVNAINEMTSNQANHALKIFLPQYKTPSTSADEETSSNQSGEGDDDIKLM